MSYNESLNGNSNYPLMSQSKWDNAPWNEEENPEEEIEVCVSLTLSKIVKVKVRDYEILNVVDDGIAFTERDYSTCDIKSAVMEQIDLPGDSTWDVDDFEAVLNE